MWIRIRIRLVVEMHVVAEIHFEDARNLPPHDVVQQTFNAAAFCHVLGFREVRCLGVHCKILFNKMFDVEHCTNNYKFLCFCSRKSIEPPFLKAVISEVFLLCRRNWLFFVKLSIIIINECFYWGEIWISYHFVIFQIALNESISLDVVIKKITRNALNNHHIGMN